jgi:hypothetical protein
MLAYMSAASVAYMSGHDAYTCARSAFFSKGTVKTAPPGVRFIIATAGLSQIAGFSHSVNSRNGAR